MWTNIYFFVTIYNMPKGFYVRTQVMKDNMSKAKKDLYASGKISPWQKGKKLPQITGKNNPFWGKKHTDESKEKMRQASLKQEHAPHTDETKLKLRIAHLGMKKGIKLTEEHRKKIGDGVRGSKSYLWKGGITPFRKFLRTCFEYNEWRKAIFKRDNYTCIIGGLEHGNKLNADHIQPFFQILNDYSIDNYEKAKQCKELWDINNGRTLCKKCHRKITNEQVKLWSAGENNYHEKRKIF